jgi:hypothetical protein
MNNFKFNEHGLVDFGDGDESKTIFQKSEMGSDMQGRVDTRGAGYAKSMGLAAQLHANALPEGTNGEPDWVGLLMQAKTERAKWTIRAARDSWKEEQRYRAVASQMAEQDAHNESVIKQPNRNKEFYDDLRVNDPRAYWSVPVQKQMRNDKQTMGLSYHLKNRGKK